MKYYPIFLRVEGRPCVVIGGGEVAERKARSLLDAGATVRVVSPTLTPGLAALARDGELAHEARAYRTGDLDGAFLAYAATDDEDLHARIHAEAETARVLLNVVDRPHWCTFIVPSTFARGDLSVAVSTAGESPALARRVREDIERSLGPEYERAVVILGRLRRRLQERSLSADERRRIFTELVESDFIERLRDPDTAAVDSLLAEVAGRDVSLASLGARFDD
jgi:precorrin-2 dehydrogenase/sirohydrochlorin ferrochelatase